MTASVPRETSIAQVRVIRGWLGSRVEIARTTCRLGPVAGGQLGYTPVGIGPWRKARASDMPELAVWMDKASK